MNYAPNINSVGWKCLIQNIENQNLLLCMQLQMYGTSNFHQCMETLPICSIKNADVFKKELKTHYFRQAYA